MNQDSNKEESKKISGLQKFFIIFLIIFTIMIFQQYSRVSTYGLYGSKETWEQTDKFPYEINYPHGLSVREATNKYGENASEFLKYQSEFINELKAAETNGIIKCYPEEQLCRYTGKGIYPYGEYSKWAQSSELMGWLSVIITALESTLILSLIIYVVYEGIIRYRNRK